MAWLALVPFVAFALAFLVGVVFLLWFAKRLKITKTQTKAGQAMHFESPVGTLDMRPEEKLDARLASIPVYPGCLRETPLSADTVSELHYGHTTLQAVSAEYWTPDAEEIVWEFYRRELPDWPRNLDESTGKELIHREADGVRLLRVTRQKEKDRTVIETCIKPLGFIFFRDGPTTSKPQRLAALLATPHSTVSPDLPPRSAHPRKNARTTHTPR